MKEETFEKLRSCDFLNNLIENTEVHVSKSLWKLCEKKSNLKNYKMEAFDEKAKIEKSTEISIYIARAFQEVICPTLKNFQISTRSINNSNCDLLIDDISWELKTCKQSEGSNPNEGKFQGSTHSSTKCTSFILIKYSVDWNKKFQYKTKPNNFINSLYMSVHHNIVKGEYWKGNPSSNNSRTSLNVPVSEFENFNMGVVYGSIKPADKWLHFVNKPFQLDEFKKRMNILSNIMKY